jgi:hypothetical protein
MENIREAASKFENSFVCKVLRDCLNLVVGDGKSIICSAPAGEGVHP